MSNRNWKLKKVFCLFLAVATLSSGMELPVSAAEFTEEAAAETEETQSETEAEKQNEAEEPESEKQNEAEDTETEKQNEAEEPESETSEDAGEAAKETVEDEETETAFVEEQLGIVQGSLPGSGTWVIDSSGKLTVNGSGEFRTSSASDAIPWYGYREEIKTAVITRTGAADFSYLFSGCKNLTSVDMSKCDTSKADRMNAMFAGCSSLESIDISNFKTSSVTDMKQMFFGCTGLKTIKFGSNFSTANVTTMESMFYNCRELADLDFKRFDTSKVTNMKRMFSGCYALTAFDFQSWNTSKVTDMTQMFESSKAESLDLSSFDMSKVTQADGMFGLYYLMDLKSPRNVKISIPFTSGTWIKDDGTVVSELPKNQSASIHVKQKPILEVSKIKTEYYIGENLDLSDLSVELIYSKNKDGANWIKPKDYTTNAAEIDMNTAGTKELIITCQGQSASIKLTVYDGTLHVAIRKTTYYTGEKLDVSDLNVTVKYSDGSGAYVSGYTTNAASIDMNTAGTKELIVTWRGLTASVFLTVQVKEDTYTYTIKKIDGIKTSYYCGATINLSNMRLLVDVNRHDGGGSVGYVYDGYTTNVDEIDMSTAGKKTLTVSYKGSTMSVELTVDPLPEYDIEYDGSRVFEVGKEPHLGSIIVSKDGKEICQTSGYTTNIKELDLSKPGKQTLRLTYLGNTISFEIFVIDAFCEDDIKNGIGESAAYRIDKNGNMTVVGMNATWPSISYKSSVKTAKLIVSGQKSLRTFFQSCNKLESVDLSELDTGENADMSYMFYGCTALKRVNFDGSDLRNVTNTEYMFYNCTALTSLDLSGVNTENVTNMDHMFGNCTALTSLDLSGFHTKNVTNMRGMFYNCAALTNLDLSGLDTRSVTTMHSMFEKCGSLKSLNLGGINTGNVTDMRSMFDKCGSLERLDLSSFDVSNTTDMAYMFRECSSLNSLDLSSFYTSGMKEMHYMFKGCSSLESLDLSSFDVSSNPSMDYMFDGCNALASLNTPRNVAKTKSVLLPDTNNGYWQSWYNKSTGRKYTQLPTVANVAARSVLLVREKTKTEDETPKEEESAKTEESSEVKESAKTEESSEVKESAKTEESSEIKEESSKEEESAKEEESSEIKESAKTEESSATKESAKEEESSEIKESAKEEESSEIKESAKTEESSATEESSGQEISSEPEDDDKTDLALAGGEISSVKDKVYDQNAYEPSVKVTIVQSHKKVTLAEGVDYLIEYQNNTNAGRGTVLAKGIGDYKGTLQTAFTIQPKSVRKLKMITGSVTTGTKSELPVYVYDGTTLLKRDKDYKLDYNADLTTKASKSAKITVTGLGSYKDSKVVKLKVYDTDASHIINPEYVVLEQQRVQYTGKALKPALTVKIGGTTLTAGKDYKVRYQDNVNAGTAYIIVTGKGDYKGDVVKPFTIMPLNASGTKLTVARIPDKIYNGTLQKPSVTVKAGKKKLVKNKDYVISYTGNLHVSANGKNAKVLIQGKGNYAGLTAEAEFAILPQKISKVSVKGTMNSLSVSYGKKQLVEGVHYEITPDASGAKKNKIKVTITGLGDFAGSNVIKTIKVQ